MTYRRLLEQLQTLNQEQLDQTVTVYEPYDDEFIPVTDTFETGEQEDVLDPYHFVLTLKA